MPQPCVAVVAGVGACLPEQVVSNDDLVRDGLNTSDRWIRSRTGIARRRRAGPGTSTGDLAVEAGAAALAAAGVPVVDLVVLATTTPDGAGRPAMAGRPVGVVRRPAALSVHRPLPTCVRHSPSRAAPPA